MKRLAIYAHYDADFEEPITIGANEWKIITEYDE
jgi:hypothetical protein